MKKPTLAVLFGGCSPEYSVSLQSSYAVLSNLNPDRYTVLPVGITQSGQWFHYTGAYDRIATDSWAEDPGCLTPCLLYTSRWFLSRHGSRSSRSMLSWTIFKVCSLYGSSPLSN